MWERRDRIQAIGIISHKKMSLHFRTFSFLVIQYAQEIVLAGHYFKIVKESPLALERTPFVRDITSLKDMNEARCGGMRIDG